MIPELAGRRTVLIPMRGEDQDLLVKWLSAPENHEAWFGREVTRADVAKRWNREFFDDAYPQKGRAFRIDVDHKPVGAAVHGPVFGEPRNALVELLLAPGVGGDVGADAVRALTQYLFDGLLVRKAWAEVAPRDPRGLEAFAAAEYEPAGRTAEQGWVVLQRMRPAARGSEASKKPK